MSITGTIGSKKVVATIYPERVEIKQKNKLLHTITELWMIGLQRVSKHLKMCDVVWLDGATQKPIIQSIAQSEVETILKHAPIDVVMLGMDPPQWSKLSSAAVENKWQKEDWLHVFSAETTTDSDEEWTPPSDEESEESEESEDEEMEYT